MSDFLSKHRRPAGFSVLELVVLVSILVILAGIFVPYFANIREADRRVRCADNLRAIMEGMRQYATLKDANGKEAHRYPSTVFDTATSGYVAYSGADSPNPFAANSAVRPNDVTASLWLLVRMNFVQPEKFICPSGGQSVDPMFTKGSAVSAEMRSNFTDGTHLSYSYASPFSSAPGYKNTDDTHVGDFALLADKNPGMGGKNAITAPSFDAPPFELAKANSRNHDQVGQNVLYADGHVSFQITVYCGVGKNGRRDNIYTALSPIPLSPGQRPPVESNGYYGRNIGPSWTNDSYLVPTNDD